MGILEKAKEHYQGVLASDPNPIEIPEWGGRYFVRPQISVKKKMEIQQKLTSEKMDEGLALTLIYYLVDDNGDACFKKLELVEIVRSVDPDVLIRVAGEIAEMQPKDEDLEKKLTDDHALLFCYQLAEHLHKTVEEVLEMGVIEFQGWIAYFEVKNRGS